MLESKKRQEWQSVKKRMAKVTDRLGMPIDVKIMEVCVGLNANGISTTFSCEGHIGTEEAYPWVRVGDPDVSALEQQLRRALQSDRLASNGGPAPLSNATKQAELALKCRHAEVRQKLTKLLTEFYEGRRVDGDVRLMIEPIALGGQCLLRSQGADLQEIREPGERAMKLKKYQAEMDAFAVFLEKKFYA